MNIAIIDADLIGRKKHRFPNLACMKIAGYYKELGHEVTLITEYIENELKAYGQIFLSKVFTDTIVPEWVLSLPNIKCGGVGFFYDKAPKLDDLIEHHMPDYHLYDEWIDFQIRNGAKRKAFTYYLDYSVGFMTRGCIRQCSFCVNKNYKRCDLHSVLSEFIDNDRPYICLLDDNVLACKDWRKVFDELITSKKKFQFKQGCDERLLTDEKCNVLFKRSKWIGDKIFAFDNIQEKDLIETKLQMIRRYTNSQIKFYTFCGYNHEEPDAYDEDFWVKDIVDLFKRIRIIMTYGCLPYVMRYKDYNLSPYRGIYINAASWCNQPSLFRKMSFAEYSMARGMSNENYKNYKMDFISYLADGNTKGSSWRYYEEFKEKYPHIAEYYFDMKWNYSNKNDFNDQI